MSCKLLPTSLYLFYTDLRLIWQVTWYEFTWHFIQLNIRLNLTWLNFAQLDMTALDSWLDTWLDIWLNTWIHTQLYTRLHTWHLTIFIGLDQRPFIYIDWTSEVGRSSLSFLGWKLTGLINVCTLLYSFYLLFLLYTSPCMVGH